MLICPNCGGLENNMSNSPDNIATGTGEITRAKLMPKGN